MDFGIATATDRLHLTVPGEVKGKAAYMAPEQAQGQRVDRRADIYAVGGVLFEALTNRRPFEGSGFVELATQQVLSAAPTPRKHRPEIPPDLEAIVLRALAKSPDDRFPTGRAMANETNATVLLTGGRFLRRPV